jgi:hypothetical protein
MSAAHPSSTSLLQHLVKHPETVEYEISVEVEASAQEVMANLLFCIVAMMHCLDSFIRCVPITGGDSLREEMANRIVSLQDKYDTTAFMRET